MFEPMASTLNTYDESQPNYTWWHGSGLGLTGVLPQGHNKVIARSQKGQICLKIVENSLFLLGLLQFSSLKSQK